MSNPKVLAGALALAHLTCAAVPLTAPSGSSIIINANPRFIAANGGVSAITAVVIEPAGTFVPDGTVVFFLTDLGRIDAQAKTKDGYARVNFVSDSRSGRATVRAFSGGSAPNPSPSATATPTGVVTAMGTSKPAAALGTPLVTNSAEISAEVTIDIGSALPADVIVTANPPRITAPRNTVITANVYDDKGNPVSNVPVIFTVDVVSGGRLLQESLDSGSQPRFTDTNGQARDVLRTSQNRADDQKEVVVNASVPGRPGAAGGLGGSVSVFIN